MRIAVMASGRGSNFEALLRSTRETSHPAELAVLISDQPTAPVLERARAAGVPVATVDPGTRKGPWTPEGIQGLLGALREHRVEAICLAGFMRIVPAEILREFPLRILNVHPALLPSFPGLRAQRQALRAGVKIAGATVHFVDEGVDTGPIVLQGAVPVEPEDTVETLSARILEVEHQIYREALRALAEDRITIDGRITRIRSGDAGGRT